MTPVHIALRTLFAAAICVAAAHAASHPASAATFPSHLLVPAIAQAINRDFGIIIDSRRVGVEGATVLAVTPGGAAEHAGLRAGDVLVSVDGRKVLDAASPASALRQALEESEGDLRLELLRDGSPLVLEGAPSTTAASTPADALPGCGYVTVDGAHPRNARAIHPVEVVSIDGIGLPIQPWRRRYRLDAGQHVLIVREHIDDHHFGPLMLSERERERRHRHSHAHKVLVVDVPADRSVHVGARLVDSLPDIASIRANSYWEPVVWNTVESRCP